MTERRSQFERTASQRISYVYVNQSFVNKNVNQYVFVHRVNIVIRMRARIFPIILSSIVLRCGFRKVWLY